MELYFHNKIRYVFILYFWCKINLINLKHILNSLLYDSAEDAYNAIHDIIFYCLYCVITKIDVAAPQTLRIILRNDYKRFKL